SVLTEDPQVVVVCGVDEPGFGGVDLHALRLLPYRFVLDALEVSPVVLGGAVAAADSEMDGGTERAGGIGAHDHLVAAVLEQSPGDPGRADDLTADGFEGIE